MYTTIKTYGHEQGLSACFRQWRAQSHCSKLHGYALAFRIEFAANELDENNWVVDFGNLKSLKQAIVNLFDHKTVIAADDPELEMFFELSKKDLIELRVLENVGCEAFADYVFDLAAQFLSDNGYKPRVWVRSVEAREHGANAAAFSTRSIG